MTSEERKHRLAQYLQKAEFASLEELAAHAEVSISTVRRDLTALEGEGLIRRTHGGARLVAPQSDEFAFTARDTHQLDEKEAIGRACAELIQPRQTVIFDVGTTVYHVARHVEDKPLQAVTNSLPVAALLGSSPTVEVVVSGGVVYPRLGVLVGPLAVEAFSKMHADIAIMSAGGITLEGLTNSHALLVDIQRAMIANAGRVIFCLDHTKIGRRSVAWLCGLEAIDTVVTDAAAPAEFVAALRERGMEVVVAGEAHPPAGPAEVAAERGPSMQRPAPVTTPIAPVVEAPDVSWD